MRMCVCVCVCVCLAGTWGFSRCVCQTYCLDETQAAESTNHCTLETQTRTHAHTHTHTHTHTAVRDETTSAGLIEHAPE